jgi:hypothetical protein
MKCADHTEDRKIGRVDCLGRFGVRVKFHPQSVCLCWPLLEQIVDLIGDRATIAPKIKACLTKSTSTEPPVEEVSASLLPKLAGFARGDWECFGEINSCSYDSNQFMFLCHPLKNVIEQHEPL